MWYFLINKESNQMYSWFHLYCGKTYDYYVSICEKNDQRAIVSLVLVVEPEKYDIYRLYCGNICDSTSFSIEEHKPLDYYITLANNHLRQNNVLAAKPL